MNENDLKKQKKILTIFVACIVVVIIAVSVSTLHLAKGTYSVSYSCPSGYSFTGTVCCPNGTWQSGGKCVYNATYSTLSECQNAWPIDDCREVTGSNGSKTYVGTFEGGSPVNPTVEYSCNKGEYFASNKCHECEAGYYCPGDDTRKACPDGKTSQPRAKSQSDCTAPTCYQDEGTCTQHEGVDQCYYVDGCYVKDAPQGSSTCDESKGEYSTVNKCTQNSTTGECDYSNGCYVPRPYGVHTITFLNANGDGSEYNKSCNTLSSTGLMDPSCSSAADRCGSWSTERWDGHSSPTNQSTGIITAGALKAKTFTRDRVYYCLAGTSGNGNGGGNTPTPSGSSNPSGSSTPSGSTTSSNTSCYQCTVNGSTKYTYAKSTSEAASNLGGTNCKATADSNCKNSNVPVNPKTGTTGIIVAWLVGLSAIVYSLWYFKKSSSMNK